MVCIMRNFRVGIVPCDVNFKLCMLIVIVSVELWGISRPRNKHWLIMLYYLGKCDFLTLVVNV